MSVRKPIDGLVETLYRERADQIVLESDQPVRICAGSAERSLIAQPIKTDQINQLLKAFVEEEELTSLLFRGSFRFRYAHPLGGAVLSVQRRGDSLRLILRPESEDESKTSELRIVNAEISTPSEQENPADPKVRKVSGVADPSSPVPQEYSDPDKPLELNMESIPPRPLPSEAYMPPANDLPAVNLSARPTSAPFPIMERPRPAPLNQIDNLLFGLEEAHGSDLHLTSGLRPFVRIDGRIQHLEQFEDLLKSADILKWLTEIAPSHALTAFEDDLDADFAYEIAGYSRYRINIFKDQRGVGAVIRGIPCEIRSLEQVGLPSTVEQLCQLEQGLVLVTGATGSGKSTTLAAMIDHVNRSRQVHIITIEDPVEFIHIPQQSLINQRELHIDTRSFPKAIRAALREDPDVILLGELRDRETIEAALEIADTGHLVFGTLHTRSAVNTVARIIEQFDAGRQTQVKASLADSLRGVISQTLCRSNTHGRVAAFEILLGSPAVANLIREGKTYQLTSILQTSRAAGMCTLNDDLLRLVQAELIDKDEALGRSNNQTELKLMLSR